jgi:RNA polymerase sigma factor for flagellar operon FliA
MDACDSITVGKFSLTGSSNVVGVSAPFDEYAAWGNFLKTRDPDLRIALIEHNTELAKILAARFYANRQIRELEFNDYFQYAMIGLIEAVDRYAIDRGAEFRTFATHRIRGAILNGVEKLCERQQQITARSRLREERRAEMSQVLSEIKDPFLRLTEMAIGTAIGFMLEDSTMFQESEPAVEDSIYRSNELRDLARVLESLVDKLPESERQVIRYHYFQQISFEDIGKLVKLTKGRISQIHRSALLRLREAHEQLSLLRTDY